MTEITVNEWITLESINYVLIGSSTDLTNLMFWLYRHINMYRCCRTQTKPKKNVSSIYLHGTEAVLDESLDSIVLGLFQNLIQFSLVLWKWYWAVSQEVQNKSKMSATPIQNYPTWDSRRNDFELFEFSSNLLLFVDLLQPNTQRLALQVHKKIALHCRNHVLHLNETHCRIWEQGLNT